MDKIIEIRRDKQKDEKFKKALEYVYQYCIVSECKKCLCNEEGNCLIKKYGAPINWYFLEDKKEG